MAHVEDRHRHWPVGKPRPTLRYRARYRGPDGRERSRCFVLKRDADRFIASVETAKARGEWTDPALGRVTVGVWMERYLRARQPTLKPKTRASYDSLLRTCLLPTWRDVPLTSIGGLDLAEWAASMTARGLSASRVRQAVHLLSGALDAAVRDRRIVVNPAHGLDLPRLRTTDIRPLTHDEVDRMVDAAGDDGLFLLLLAYCGLRFGEAAGLRRKRLDLMRGRLEVVESLSEVGSELAFVAPKTHQRRSVPIPAFLRDALTIRLAGLEPDQLVFTAPGGGPLRYSPWRRRVFDRACAHAALAGVRPHDLRHTCASWLIATGANVKAVQTMLGHSSVQTTLDRYGHLFPDDLDSLGASLDAAAASARAARPRHDLGADVVPIKQTGS